MIELRPTFMQPFVHCALSVMSLFYVKRGGYHYSASFVLMPTFTFVYIHNHNVKVGRDFFINMTTNQHTLAIFIQMSLGYVALHRITSHHDLCIWSSRWNKHDCSLFSITEPHLSRLMLYILEGKKMRNALHGKYIPCVKPHRFFKTIFFEYCVFPSNEQRLF